jgi:signal transduction histidine kinase
VASGASSSPAPHVPPGKLVRRSGRVDGRAVTTLYVPFRLGGRPAGELAVSAATRPAFASVRAAAYRIALIVLAAVVGATGIGVLLARFIVAQLGPLLATNRALEAGDLSARAPVLGRDELGQLAVGVNAMAERLQANYETLEERVRERTEEVERLLRERTELFTSVSHEFRTPLAVILAKAESLQDASYAKTATWCADVGRMVEQSGRQLLAFVNDVLELARAESGGLEIALGPVDLHRLVAELRGAMTGLAAAAGVALSIQVRRDLSPVVADRVRVQEILLNLVDNALKYTPTGGRVVLAASNGGGAVAVRVTDTGVGIPPEVGDRIFEPFYRVAGTRTQRSEPSSGLGLAVTRRLVEAQGGTITYESEPGAGTSVVFTLPTLEG